MLCNSLEKYKSHPGFSLLLGSILQYSNHTFLCFPPGMVASLCLIRQQGQEHILNDMGFSGVIAPGTGELPGTPEFFTYFIELLENPERSGTHAFDQHRYVTAAKECLQLCLCSHHKFSKGATERVCRDKALLRNQPWTWKAQLGVHSRIRKAMNHGRATFRRWNLLKYYDNYQHYSLPQYSSK